MKKIHEYLYYRLYTWNLKTWGANDGPEFNASLGIAFLIGMHSVIIILMIDIILMIWYKIYNFLEIIPNAVLIGSMLIFIVITYFWFVHKKKYLKIIKKYKNETKKQKSVRGLLLFLYIVLSIGVILLLAYINKHVRIMN